MLLEYCFLYELESTNNTAAHFVVTAYKISRKSPFDLLSWLCINLINETPGLNVSSHRLGADVQSPPLVNQRGFIFQQALQRRPDCFILIGVFHPCHDLAN